MYVDRIAVYVRNKELTPSSYYRIVQYTESFEGKVLFREIAPKSIYKLKRKYSHKRGILRYLIDSLYYIVMLLRVTYFLLVDNLIIPNYIIVSKTFLPRFTPLYLLVLIKLLISRTNLYWDFDDNIFISGEISKRQRKLLEVYSKNIIVTNEFLKGALDSVYHHKVQLMPTTDGDLQGFDKVLLRKERMATYKTEVRLVWVATSGNIKHIIRIIDALDSAAKKIYEVSHKQLILLVVCDRPIDIMTEKLVIRNITWTREIAKEAIYNSHIGVMPLINNEYTKGKGGFKLVQYISTGLPVIASDVSYNEEIVDEKCGILVQDTEITDLWINACIQLSIDELKWCEFSDYAYQKWLDNFSYLDNLEKWKSLLKNKL